MFKIFHRGHKISFNNQLNSSNNSNDKTLKASNRNSTFFTNDEYLDNHKQQQQQHHQIYGLSPNARKKIITSSLPSKRLAPNLRQFEEYEPHNHHNQIDEEDETAKKASTPRYNGVTSLLMRSFRKAKDKKKNELKQEIEETYRQTSQIYDALPQLTQQSKTTPKNSTRRMTSVIKPMAPKIDSKQQQQQMTDSLEEKQSESDDNDDDEDGGAPVFIGMKMNTQEFVDYPPKQTKQKPPQTSRRPSQQQVDLLSSENPEIETKTRILNPSRNLNSNNTQSRYNTLNSSRKLDSQFSTDNQQIYNSLPRKVEVSKYLDNKLTRKQHLKQENLKNDNDTESHTTTEELSMNDKDSYKQKSGNVKRSKTFTQHIDDMLKSYKSQTTLNTCVNEPKIDKEVRREDKQKKDEIKEQVVSSTPLAPRREKHLQKSKVESKKNTANDDRFSVVLREINDFVEEKKREESAKKLHVESELVQKVLVPQKVSPVPSTDSNSDEFLALVSVLGKQDNKFKYKFFNCLMPKLWDANLPYEEYVQFNKLMTALFGEDYHTLDDSTRNLARKIRDRKTPTLCSDDEGVDDYKYVYAKQHKTFNSLLKDYIQNNYNGEIDFSNFTMKKKEPTSNGSSSSMLTGCMPPTGYPCVPNLLSTLKRKQQDRREQDGGKSSPDTEIIESFYVDSFSRDDIESSRSDNRQIKPNNKLKSSLLLSVSEHDDRKNFIEYGSMEPARIKESPKIINSINKKASQDESINSSILRNKLRTSYQNFNINDDRNDDFQDQTSIADDYKSLKYIEASHKHFSPKLKEKLIKKQHIFPDIVIESSVEHKNNNGCIKPLASFQPPLTLRRNSPSVYSNLSSNSPSSTSKNDGLKNTSQNIIDYLENY